MAALSDTEREALAAAMMRELSAEFAPIPILKAQVRAAIDAVDAWIEANAASFNSALPAAARNNLTPAQKARLLTLVARRRFEVS